jgi:hypothetical protein
MVQSINAMELHVPLDSVEFFWSKLDKKKEGRVKQHGCLLLFILVSACAQYPTMDASVCIVHLRTEQGRVTR